MQMYLIMNLGSSNEHMLSRIHCSLSNKYFLFTFTDKHKKY